MTFIFNPGLGELVDRLSIVARKNVERGELATLASEEFLHLTGLLHFSARRGNQGLTDSAAQELLGWMFTLCAVNAAIWEREDTVRRDTPERNITIYEEIAKLNDLRRHLITKLSGVDADPKIYK
jgi:hypothetical protein